jgi:hypothetical protein
VVAGIQLLSRLARSLLSEPAPLKNNQSQHYQPRYESTPSWQANYNKDNKDNEDGFKKHAEDRSPLTKYLRAWVAERSEGGEKRSAPETQATPEAETSVAWASESSPSTPSTRSTPTRRPSGEVNKTPYELAAQPRYNQHNQRSGAGPLQAKERKIQTQLLNTWLSQLPQGSSRLVADSGAGQRSSTSSASRATLGGSSSGRQRTTEPQVKKA